MSNTPNPVYEKLMKCYESFRSQIDFQPEVALILGSGLGDFANDIRVTATLDYHDIEGSGFHCSGPRGPFYLRLRRRCAGCLHAGPRSLL